MWSMMNRVCLECMLHIDYAVKFKYPLTLIFVFGCQLTLLASPMNELSLVIKIIHMMRPTKKGPNQKSICILVLLNLEGCFYITMTSLEVFD